MSVSAGQKGLAAVKSHDWAAALPLLDKALEDSESPTWLIARAQAHQQLGRLEPALRDAELAYHTAVARGSRKQMIDAQYRRACVLNRLGRLADSDCCAKWSLLLCEGQPAANDDGWVAVHADADGCYTVTPGDAADDREHQPRDKDNMSMITGLAPDAASKTTGAGASGGTKETGFRNEWNRAYIWRSQVVGAMEKLPRDHPGRKVTVTKIPPRPQPKTGKEAEEDAPEVDGEAETSPHQTAETAQPAQDAQVVPDEKLKLRVDFYQNNNAVTVTVFAKDIQPKTVEVVMLDHAVTFGPVPREAMPSLSRQDRQAHSTLFLADKIDPKASRWSATARKIELVLQKATPGVKWATWGREEIGIADSLKDSGETASVVKDDSSAPKPGMATAPTTTATATTATADSNPAYPTSSKSGPKNWDKVVQAGDDDANEEDQDVNYFFKKLYAGATEEQRRAMMKSFTESNGTSLSTDWNDVKDRTVETAPPDGVEARKWDV